MEEEDIWDLLRQFKPFTDENKEETSETLNLETLECKNCKSNDIMLDDCNYVCKKCNALLSRYIDMQAEWRYYGCDDSKSSDPTRCGMPTNDLLPNSSLGSLISNQNNESYDMKLIRKYHMWNSMSYKERSLYNIFDSITINAANSGIPTTIIEEAKVFYKKLSESRISRGENRNGLIASSIYMSCKTHKVPRSTKEIAKIFNLKVTTMTKGCKKFQDIMNIDLESTSAVDFIQRFGSKLNISLEIKNLCKHIVEKADYLNIVSENTPPSIAAASIFLCNVVCDLGLQKKEMAKACEISQVTLTKCFKKLYTYRAHIFPKEAILAYNIK
jgi:transcription initiation factor TFIIB